MTFFFQNCGQFASDTTVLLNSVSSESSDLKNDNADDLQKGFSATDADLSRSQVSGPLQGKVFPTQEELDGIYDTSSEWAHEWSGLAWPNSIYSNYVDYWDVPHGDDDVRYSDPNNNCGVHYNFPEDGIVRIDTIKSQSNNPCPLTSEGRSSRSMTAFLLKRDPRLDTQSGLTFEFRLRILKHNQKIQSDAVTFQMVNGQGSIGLVFSWDCVKAGPSNFPNNMEDSDHRNFRFSCESIGSYRAAKLDATVFRTYRIVLHK